MQAESTARQDELGNLARQIASQIKGDPRIAENVLHPNFSRQSATRPEQVAAINSIVKAGDLMSSRREQAAVAERRAADAEDKVEALKRLLVDAEDKLTSTLIALDRERKRAEELERRSAEMLDRTQAMITDASERLTAAEKRASLAEDYLSTLQSMIRDRLDVA